MEGIVRRRIKSLQILFLGLTATVVIFVMSYIRNAPSSNSADGFGQIFTMKNGSVTCETFKNFTPSVDFPRHIHQTWKDANIPEKWRELNEGCRRMNPGYKFTVWTDSDLETFIADKYPWFLKTYSSYPYPIQRVDAARYFILHYYGGAYIDLDIRCKEPIDHILKKIPADKDTILGATAPVGITNSLMISKPKHPFMLYIISRLESVNGWYVLPYWTIMFSTGPLMVWRGYTHYPCRNQVVVLSVQEINEIYFEHTHGSSWHTWDGPLMVWLDSHLVLVIILGFLSLSFTAVLLYRRCVVQRRKCTSTSCKSIIL